MTNPEFEIESRAEKEKLAAIERAKVDRLAAETEHARIKKETTISLKRGGQLRRKAELYRKNQATPKGGFVMFCGSFVCGWSEDPEVGGWEPGILALPEVTEAGGWTEPVRISVRVKNATVWMDVTFENEKPANS